VRWLAGPHGGASVRLPAPNNQRSNLSQRPAPAAMMEKGAPVDLELVNNLRDELAWWAALASMLQVAK